MWFPSLLLSLLLSLNPRAGRRRKPHRTPAAERRSFRPRVEVLEDRTVLSTLTVLNNLDNGPGSLRAEVALASSGDTIGFANSLKQKTITLTSGELAITKDLDIKGLGAQQLAISGNHASRIFDLSAGVSLTVTDLSLTNGWA